MSYFTSRGARQLSQIEEGRLLYSRWHSRQRRKKCSLMLVTPGCAGPCAPKKMPRPGLGNEAKRHSPNLHVPREPGGNWHLATSKTTLIRLSWRRRARNPSATLHEERVTPLRARLAA